MSEKFGKETIEDYNMPMGGRSLEIYEKELMFDRAELNGKIVLDLGAGPEVKLANDLKNAEITAEVVSLSPDFRYKKYLNKAKEAMPEAKLVGGVGQKLPFKEETFDYVLSSHIFEHVGEQQLLKIMLEISRILKFEGKAIIGPIYEWENEEGKLFKKISKKLEENNIQVNRMLIPENIVPRYVERDMYSGDKHSGQAFNIVLEKNKLENL